MLIRVTLLFFKTSSFPNVIVSGLPHSTVNSLYGKSICFKINDKSLAESVVGVPPPI